MPTRGKNNINISGADPGFQVRGGRTLKRTDALLSNIYITEHDVKDILQTLKIGKACGDDGITHQMLKMYFWNHLYTFSYYF